MILYPFLILVFIGVIYITGLMLLRNSQDLVILWGNSVTIETSTFALVFGLLAAFIVGYFALMVLSWAFSMPRRVAKAREQKRIIQAQNQLNSGLVNLVEGHWDQAETALVASVYDSETPLLNYLGAARAAHMKQNYLKRDEYLKSASAYGEEAEIAVAVSQAAMQMESEQIEQARATLIHLRELSPEHPYPNQLLAKVYLLQEDWKQLAELIPELIAQSGEGADKGKFHQYMQRAVVGLFEITSGKQDLPALEAIWQKLPAVVKQEPYALGAYASALSNAGGGDVAAPLLEEKLANVQSRELFSCYGKIQHRQAQVALAKAKEWEVRDGTDPALLLCLARLEQQCGNQATSADYFEQALTLVPDQQVYYEFAQLLSEQGDIENANRCYQQGLRYCVQGKTRPFKRS